MPLLVETRGPKFGKCNICGVESKLTEDHTPPKGCLKIKQVELHHIMEHLNLSAERAKGRLSQNGVKYRTLCGDCNNRLLGTEYDPEFIHFVNSVGTYLKANIKLPSKMIVRAKPQRVMLSLLGHLCAQGVNRFDKGDITQPIAEYFKQESKLLPNQIKIYFWPFPYNNHVMARDCALMDLKKKEPIVIWFLKFFPVGFLVTFNEPEEYDFGVVELSQWRSESIDFETEVPIYLNKIMSQFWPEAPTKTSVVFYGNEAIASFDWKKKLTMPSTRTG